MHKPLTHRVGARRPAGGLLWLITLTCGCSPGVQWRGYTFDPVYADSRRDQKLTFVYFRHWAVTACTDFEEKVLKHPAVLQELHSGGAFYCAVLDFLLDRPLADQWQIAAPPGVVILAPDERVLAKLDGAITADDLLKALRAAKEAAPVATRSARTGP